MWDTLCKRYLSIDMSRCTVITVFVLMALAGASYLPFVYQNAFGEDDCYRMAAGFLESLSSGKRYESPLGFYANRTSFGYYAFLYLFEDALKESPTLLFALMNYTSAACSVLIVLPLFFIVRRYWGYAAAVLANLILILIPIWRNISLYGHPQTPAVLFVFIGLALLGYRHHLMSQKSSKGLVFLCDVFSLLSLIVSLTMRMDAVLLFPLITACLLLEGRTWRSALMYSVLYGASTVIVYFLLRSPIPEPQATTAALLEQHSLARAIEYFRSSIFVFLSAYPLVLMLTFIISCVLLLRARNYPSLAFVLPVVLINYLFYMPNFGHRGRHFHFIAPVIATGAAILLSRISDLLRSFKPSGYGVRETILVFLIFLAASVVFTSIGPFSGYRNMLSEHEAQTFARFSRDLLNLAPQDRPVFVVSNSRPVIVPMQMMDSRLKVTRVEDIFYVQTDRNEFVFCKHGSYEDYVTNLRKEADHRGMVYWVIDPYFDPIREKPFNAHVPPPHIALDVLRAQLRAPVIDTSQKLQ